MKELGREFVGRLGTMFAKVLLLLLLHHFFCHQYYFCRLQVHLCVMRSLICPIVACEWTPATTTTTTTTTTCPASAALHLHALSSSSSRDRWTRSYGASAGRDSARRSSTGVRSTACATRKGRKRGEYQRLCTAKPARRRRTPAFAWADKIIVGVKGGWGGFAEGS